ncbi:MAG: carboxypeptidase regulatory-like domain-containing protein [Planctomycetes bacterium]|nr:carboxypeptidase regulatory-like domain-containing protein [Planctomycetota bacterium]
MTTYADGTPAPHVGFLLQRFASGASREPRAFWTDAEGRALLEGLVAGEYALYADRGGNAGATVPAVTSERAPDAALLDELTPVVTLRLPEGHDVRGRVVDGAGRPVADAELWISNGITRSYGLAAGRTDAAGRFELRQLQDDCFLGARHARFGPSRPQHVQYWSERTRPGAPIELELALGDEAAALDGVVYGPDGAPLAGATVRVGAQTNQDTFGPTGAEGPPPPVSLVSDENGAFAAAGLASGAVGVSARAPGLAVGALEVTLAPGERGRVELHLVEGAWVRGVVLDAGGAPLAGATVGATEAALHAPNPPAAFLPPYATSDAQGRFELGPLAPGAVHLSARGPSFLPDGTRLPTTRTSAELVVRAGEAYAWSARLEGEPYAAGRALDERGEPLAEWTVVSHAEHGPGPAPRAVDTDETGAFRVPIVGEGTVALWLYPPSHPEHPARLWSERRAPVAWVEGVRAGDRDVVLRRDAAQAPSARLVATLDVAGADERTLAHVTVRHERFGPVADVEYPALGPPLQLEELPAGAVQVLVEAPGCAALRAGPFELRDGETFDAGTLRAVPGGALRVTIEAPGGGPLSGLSLELRDAQGRLWHLPEDAGAWRRDDLPAGRYTLRAHAQDAAPYRAELEVRAGETCAHEVHLAPGASLGIVLLGADGRPLHCAATLRVTTADGEVLCDERVEPSEAGQVSRWVFAPFGELVVSGAAEDGRRGEGRVTCDATSAREPQVVRLE